MTEDVRNEVLRRWYGGQSMRGIARDLHLSRKTVAGTIAGHQQQRAQGVTGLPAPSEVRGSQVDSYEATLREYLARYPKMSVVRLLEELRRVGYTGGYTILRQRVKQLRPQFCRPPVERFETGPGVQAQMDYGIYAIDFTEEGRRKVNLFSYLLGYSPTAVPAFHGVPGLRDHAPRARAGLHAPGRRGRYLPLRQHESRGRPLRRRRADLQHPLPGFRHALRLQVWACRPQAAADEGQSGDGHSTL